MNNTSEPEVVEYAGFRDLEPDGILEQPFYERYNSRLEMPISFCVAVLMPVAMVFLMVLIGYLASIKNHSPVNIMHLDGDDDAGVGSAGTGGVDEPLNIGAAPTAADMANLPKEADIAKVKEEARAAIRIDGATDVDISDATAAALGTLHEDLRQKINGQKRGSGKGGTGGDEGTGTGPGGTGHDSTRARALRWVIKFDTRSGKDYVDQIGGLGGVIVLQMRDDNKRVYIYKSLNTSLAGKIATDSDLTDIASWLRFEDVRRNSVEAVAEALSLGYTPPVFFAYFPKSLEEKLDKLERQHANKDPKDVKETVFKVVRRGGEYDLFVTNQIMR
ncbi:hypothetical protein BH11PLA2_BH11PLA2_19350 [soil metagenome]